MPFGSLRVALKALIASLVMALAILPVHTLHIFIIIPIAILVYLGVSVLIGVIPREDYQAVYRAIRRKAQPTSSPSTNDLPEIALPPYHAEVLLEDGLIATVKLPARRPRSMQPGANGLAENPQPPYHAEVLLEDGLAPTVKLPTIRIQSMQQIPTDTEIQIVPVSEEYTGNNEVR